MMTPDDSDYDLPTYLRLIEPLEIEDIPLQVALLTMELASLRRMLTDLGTLILAGIPEAPGLVDLATTPMPDGTDLDDERRATTPPPCK